MARKKTAKNRNKITPVLLPVSSTASLFFISLLWAVPFLNPYHTHPLPDFYTEWISFGLALLAMTIMVQAGVWREGLRIPRIVLAPFLLGLVLASQALSGRVAYPETVWQAEIYLMWTAAMIWLGAVLREQVGWEVMIRWLSWAALVGGVVSALFGLMQYLGWYRAFVPLIAFYKGGAVYGNLGQANHFASYLGVALVSLGYLVAVQRIARSWAITSGILLLLGMVLSGSRSTVVYLLLFVAVAHIQYWRSSMLTGKLLRGAAWLSVPMYLVLMLALTYLPEMMGSGVSAVGSDAGIASTTQTGFTAGGRIAALGALPVARLFLWQQAWHMFLDAPLLGVGWGEFTWQFFLHFSDIPNPGVPTVDPNAHNFILHLLATAGVLGMLAILTPLVLWVWRAGSLPASAEKWWLVCILAVQGVHGMLEYNLWYAQFLGLAALLLGMGETAYFRFSAIAWKKAGWGWLALLVSAFILLAGVMQDYRILEKWYYGGNRATQTEIGKLQSGLHELQKDSLFRPLAELFNPGMIIPDSASSAEKLKLNLRMMRFAPNSEVVYRHVMLLASSGEQDEALEQLAHAIAVYPKDLAAFVQRIKRYAELQPEAFGKIFRKAQEQLNEATATQIK